jgi:hypothetical protein
VGTSLRHLAGSHAGQHVPVRLRLAKAGALPLGQPAAQRPPAGRVLRLALEGRLMRALLRLLPT